MKQYYIFRVNIKTGRKEYRRTKCVEYYTTEAYKANCWTFSKQAAEKITKRSNEQQVTKFYEYGYEEA